MNNWKTDFVLKWYNEQDGKSHTFCKTMDLPFLCHESLPLLVCDYSYRISCVDLDLTRQKLQVITKLIYWEEGDGEFSDLSDPMVADGWEHR